MDPISKALAEHYSEKFSLHGPSSEGVDWGADEARMFLRYDKMLGVADFAAGKRQLLLDVGCGYGGLQRFAASKNIDLDYTGIDVAENMIEWARVNLPSGKFVHGDILDYKFDRQFDYVVCNGILTQKLEAAGLEMDQFANELIRRMFSLCTIGIAFNVMTTKVNYYSNNLYYRNPAELLSWCLSEITPHLKLDHSYPLYEYTIYLYRNPV
ncbi:MAG TPA: class I SAM-dependent methyltransferase [Pyrinomonadaceae bacterium]|jgi:SAM-dependent methyltransferase